MSIDYWQQAIDTAPRLQTPTVSSFQICRKYCKLISNVLVNSLLQIIFAEVILSFICMLVKVTSTGE